MYILHIEHTIHPNIKNNNSAAALSLTQQHHSWIGSVGAITTSSERLEEHTTAPTVDDFFSAAKEGNLVKVKYCVNSGIDKDAKDYDGWTALHYASWKGHLEIVQYLIETCQVDKIAKNNSGQSAYIIAMANNKSEVVQYLQNVRSTSPIVMPTHSLEEKPTSTKPTPTENGLLVSVRINRCMLNRKGKIVSHNSFVDP